MPQTNYFFAYEEACRALAAERAPRAVATRAGVRYVEAGETDAFFEVPFLGRLYRVDYPSGKVTPGEPLAGAPSVPPAPSGDHLLTISILLPHYLTKAKGIRLEGEWIAFRELPGGDIYNTPFTNRTIRPMVGRFGREPARLVEAGEGLGGRRETFGHASTRVLAFPMVPLCFIVWEGDEEIPASGQILFDRSASAYLDTEDLVVVAGEAFLALRMAASPGQPRPGAPRLTAGPDRP